MPDYATLTEMLLAMSESKLRRLRDGTRDEIQRLGMELRFLEDALARKQGAKARIEAPIQAKTNGRANDLPRADLFAYVVEYGKPAKPTPLKEFLATKGIVRSPQAVRNGLVRLERDGKLVLTADGNYVVAKKMIGSGSKSEAGSPEGTGASFEASGLQP